MVPFLHSRYYDKQRVGVQSICQAGYSRDKIWVTEDSRRLTVKAPLNSWKMDTHAAELSCVTQTHQISYSVTGIHLHPFRLPREAHPPNPSLSAVSLHWLWQALLKSVPVSWARMRKERDWVVPVRGCQSSVSWISLFLLRSLGIKQGRFSTLRPCLHTHPGAAHGRHRLTQPQPTDSPLSHQPS